MDRQMVFRMSVIFIAFAVLITVLIIIMRAVEKAEEPDFETEIIQLEETPTYFPDAEIENTDWEEEMIRAVISGSETDGHVAQFHLAAEGCTEITYDNVSNLAKIMAAESGVEWPDYAVMAIGEVVLNRVASPEFPDTIHDVLFASDPIQYEPVYNGSWNELQPTERYVRLAVRLLQGERVLNDESIVFQALFAQGYRTVLTYYDKYLDTTTYFCISNYPEVYES